MFLGSTNPRAGGQAKEVSQERGLRFSQWMLTLLSSSAHTYFHFVWAPNGLLCELCGLRKAKQY